MAYINCDTSCFLKKRSCKGIKQCACSCGSLQAINPNLFDACVKQCNSSDRPKDAQDFICRFIGGETMFNMYGVLACGMKLEDTTQYKTYDVQQENDKETEEGSRIITYIILAVFALIIMGGLALLFRSSSKKGT